MQDDNRTSNRLISTADLLQQIAAENHKALEVIRLTDVEVNDWMEYRQLIEAVNNAALAARTLADHLRTPPRLEEAAA